MTRRPKTILVLLFITLALITVPLQPAGAQNQTLPLPADLFVLNDIGQVMLVAPGSDVAALITPPDQIVADFGISPDGKWIAYRTASNPFLAVTSIDNQSGQLIEFEQAGQPPVTGRGPTLAWAPDGAAMAYTIEGGIRVYLAGVSEYGAPAFMNLEGGPFLGLVWSPGGGYLAAEAENNSWSVYRRDGAKVTFYGQIPSSAGMAWIREGVLAIAPPSGGLIGLNLADGSQQTLQGAEVTVSQPTLISDDRLIYLVHEGQQQFAARRFGIVSTSGTDNQIFEASVELTAAMEWLPDGVALITPLDGNLTIIEPRTNARRELMEGVKTFAWGPMPLVEVSGIAMPEDLYFLANDAAGIAQLWRLPADSRAAEQVTSETSSVLDFDVSPDRSQIAYSSGGRLMVANRDGSGAHELSPIVERPGAGAQPAWSPDGRRIAFVRDGIWIMSSSGGPRTELITDSLEQGTPPDQVRVYMNPRWHPNGSVLLIDIGYYEGKALGILPLTGDAPIPLNLPATRGTWLPDGRVIAWDYGFGYTTPGLYLMDLQNLTSYVTILDDSWNIYDTRPLASEAVVILRNPSGDTLGPGAVQPFLVPVLPDALPIPRGQGGLLEAAVISPDGTMAAGLSRAEYGDYGQQGKLVVVLLETGERIGIKTPGNIWGLQWGGLQ